MPSVAAPDDEFVILKAICDEVDERLILPMPYVGLFIVAAVSYTEISVASVPVEITQSLLHTASRPVHIFVVAGFAASRNGSCTVTTESSYSSLPSPPSD